MEETTEALGQGLPNVAAYSSKDLPGLLADISALAAVAARLAVVEAPRPPERLMKIEELAQRMETTVDWLRRRFKATQIARIDPEEFYDFQATRPEVSLIDGTTRKVSWPANEYSVARVEEVGRDLVLFSGVEPNL